MHNASKLETLMTSALPPSAFESNVHAMATPHTTQFKLMIEKKTSGINVQLNTARKELVEKNQPQLCQIIDSIITGGCQS